jgi:AraC-like DNA-binding protein/quercetin dioxygenase-like cupin family protein
MSESVQAISFNPFIDGNEYEVMFAGWSRTDPGHYMGPLIHSYYLIHYVISGQGHFKGMGKDYTLHPGDSFIIYPNELVQYTADDQDPWEYCWVAFNGNRFDKLLRKMKISPTTPIVRANGSRRLRPLLRLIERTLARREEHDAILADGYLQQLLGEYAIDRIAAASPNASAAVMNDAHIDHAIGLLTHRYYQPISIAELAREIGYHRTYFSKVFKERTGMSPLAFLMKIRMEQARTLLRSDLSIEQIAMSVGFNDPLYFSKQFKRWYGMSPSHYR